MTQNKINILSLADLLDADLASMYDGDEEAQTAREALQKAQDAKRNTPLRKMKYQKFAETHAAQEENNGSQND